MTENKEIPKEQVLIEQPQQSEPELTKAQIETQIKFWWGQIEKDLNYDSYIEAWKQYDYFSSLKINYKK